MHPAFHALRLPAAGSRNFFIRLTGNMVNSWQYANKAKKLLQSANIGNIFPIMSETVKNSLHASIVKLLRPLVRILLRYGVSFGEFAETARRVLSTIDS